MVEVKNTLALAVASVLAAYSAFAETDAETAEASWGCACDDVQTEFAQDIVVRDGDREWRFVPVEGTSMLPVQYLRTGKDRQISQSVSLPRYWIATNMVTEGDLAIVTGRPVRPGKEADQPLADIEWGEAHSFSEAFAFRYAAQLPRDTLVSIPSMIEWAHAVQVLDGRVDLCGDVGTFLFTGSVHGGFLHTYWRGARPLQGDLRTNDILACSFEEVPKRLRQKTVGLRMVLIPVRGQMLGDNPVVMRGIIALQHGFYDEAQRHLILARTRGSLSEEDLARADDALVYAQHPKEEDLEDWSGLVARAAAFAAERGFETEPYASCWQRAGLGETTNAACVAAYRSAGIFGGWLPVGDLPREIRAQQASLQNPRVQSVVCDFTGDGRSDLVVERFGNVGSAGYWYDFYRREPDGTYTNVYALQTVGICVLPRRGGGCGFLTVDKVSNPVLAVRMLWYEDGQVMSTPASTRAFGMLDAREDRIYRPSPFIGGGLGMGWSILEDRGVWYRPFFWPWKCGTVRKGGGK